MFSAECESDRVLEVAIKLPIRTVVSAETSSLWGRWSHVWKVRVRAESLVFMHAQMGPANAPVPSYRWPRLSFLVRSHRHTRGLPP